MEASRKEGIFLKGENADLEAPHLFRVFSADRLPNMVCGLLLVCGKVLLTIG